MKHVFIIGSKGIPAKYGGFETFVDKLTQHSKAEGIRYHVACISDKKSEFEYNGAHCFNVKVPQIGAARAVYYDMAAFRWCIGYIKRNKIKDAIVYVLACRIGPFVGHYKKQLKEMGGTLYLNPDGHEWKRSKWNFLIRKYWKFSERLMVKHAELLVCDSKNIEKYIRRDYARYSPRTTYIAYGAEVSQSTLSDDDENLVKWYGKNGLARGQYYLVVGRFVPENNYETMLREFMKSNTQKKLVLITNVEQNRFYDNLRIETGFDRDSRIKFVGTVYNQELLKKIRQEAFAYIHGHEVGGTNPSLLEALAATRLNLLYDVGFNKEVAGDSALYWNKEAGNLSALIDKCEKITEEQINKMDKLSTKRIADEFSWEKIVDEYEKIFRETKR